MYNVGFGIYSKGAEPGTLDAKWCHSYFGSGVYGTGRAVGGPIEGYEGSYEIKYFDRDQNEVAGFNITIVKVGETYEITWYLDGEVQDRGLGLEVSDGLAFGWTRMVEGPPEEFETIEEERG